MAQIDVVAGATSVSILAFIQDSSSTTGQGLAAVAPAGGSLLSGTTAYYSFTGTSAAAVAISLSVLATVGAAWSSAGIVTLDDVHMKGWVRIDLPNAALAASSGRSVAIHIYGGTNMAPCPILIQLTGWNNQDAVHGGMSALPNTACTTNASLLTSGTGTDQLSVTSGRIDIGKALGTAVTLDANSVLNVSAKYWAGTAITATSIPVATAAGAAGGLFIAGTNAATTITTSLTTHLVGTVDTVTTVGTLTTYTGNTPQTGDSFARIGALGAGLTALAQSSSWTSGLATTISTNLNATITSRMATFTLPTNFSAFAITAAGGVTLADGVAHGGPPGSSTATYAGANFNLTNPSGRAFELIASGTALYCEGQGSNTTVRFRNASGGTGLDVDGVLLECPSGAVAGLEIWGGATQPAVLLCGPFTTPGPALIISTNSGNDLGSIGGNAIRIETTDGHCCDLVPTGTNVHGINIAGGSISGNAINLSTTTPTSTSDLGIGTNGSYIQNVILGNNAAHGGTPGSSTATYAGSNIKIAATTGQALTLTTVDTGQQAVIIEGPLGVKIHGTLNDTLAAFGYDSAACLLLGGDNTSAAGNAKGLVITGPYIQAASAVRITTTIADVGGLGGNAIEIASENGHAIDITPFGTTVNGLNIAGGSVSGNSINLTTTDGYPIGGILGAPRDMSAIADGSITINDAFWAAIGAGVGAKDASGGTTYTVSTPLTGTLLRTYTLTLITPPDTVPDKAL